MMNPQGRAQFGSHWSEIFAILGSSLIEIKVRLISKLVLREYRATMAEENLHHSGPV